MVSLKRPALALGAAAVMALSLSACGGGASGAPKDASQQAFCDNWNTAGSSIDDSASAGDQADEAHKVADSLKKVGTPSDMSADARKGFELFVDFLGKVDSGDVKKLTDSSDSSDSNGPWSGDDKTKVQAFLEYATTKCTDVSTSLPTDMSMPTDGVTMPSTIPTQ